jgi:hypothetical protein
MIHVKRQQIESMLLLAAILHLVLAAIAYYVGEDRAPLSYAGFLGSFVMNTSFFFILRRRGGEGELPSFFAAITSIYFLAHAYFFYPARWGGIFHAALGICMLIAVIDVSVLLRTRAALLLQGSALILTLAALSSMKAFGGPYVIGPVLVLLAWKISLYVHVRESQAERERLRQLEAFRATVVTLNHEFNNVSAICQPLLQKLRSLEGGAASMDEADFEMLERNLARLVKSIKGLRKIERYEEVVYVGDTKMVSLDAEETALLNRDS